MNHKFRILLALAPVFAMAYFIRIGQSSVYIFDLYFIILFFSSLYVLPKYWLNKNIIFSLLIVIVVLLGFILNEVFGEELGKIERLIPALLRYIQFLYVLLCVVYAVTNASFKPVKSAGSIFYWSMLFPLAYGAFFLNYAPDSVLVFGRLSSYLSNPNNLGAFICIAIPPINLYLASLNGSRRIFMALLFYSLALYSLVYAGSNSGWSIAVISTLLSLMTIRRISIPVLLGVAVFIGTIGVAGSLLYENMLESEIPGLQNTGKLIQSIQEGGDLYDLGSGRLRESLLADARELFISKPRVMVVGVGLAQSPSYIGAKYNATITAHNAYLVLLVELGLLGFLVLVVAFWRTIKPVGLSAKSISLVSGYLLAMLATPHVYLPFLWGTAVFGIYINRNSLNLKNKNLE
jgi:hypothetical protein